MGWLDLIILMAVVVFIVTRFTKFNLPTDTRPKGKGEGERGEDWRQLLGRNLGRPGERSDDTPAKSKVVDITPVRKLPKKVDLTGLSGLEQIKALDPAFDENRFLDGTDKAYGYFYDCWNRADEDGLANLCAPQLLNQLTTQLEAYAARSEQPSVQVDGILERSIAEARVNGRTAVIEVEFLARQSVDGGPLHEVRSRWTLARPIGSEDPNWELQQVLELGGQV